MKSFIKFASAAALAIGTLSTGVAHANLSCVTNVTQVDIAGNGMIYVTGTGVGTSFDHNALCSVSSQVGGYTADACKELNKTLTAALLSGKKVTFWFNGGSSSCAPGSWTDLTNPAYGVYFANILK
ncbi:MAG: hypothetical protein SF187_19190 [Deltaproteobacteria bacterium]|nr:hypothetical protein [Deltaproteobacteria bacterium]